VLFRSEIERLLGIHELLFGKTPADEFVPLEGDVAAEVGELLRRRGFDDLVEWASIENLEERLWEDGTRIDPVVLEVLRGAR